MPFSMQCQPLKYQLEIVTPSKFADVITINGTDKILSKLTTAVKSDR